MRNIMILGAAALATLAVPAAAGPWDGDASDDPVAVRAEYVWEVSKVVCPRAFQEGQDANAVIDRAGVTYRLNSNERLLLGNYCITYSQGMIDVLGRL